MVEDVGGFGDLKSFSHLREHVGLGFAGGDWVSDWFGMGLCWVILVIESGSMGIA